MNKTLYETDFYTWVNQQATLLREGQFEKLDLSNLIEEIEDLGKRHYDQLESRLTQLVANRHLS